jgi:hypothetical protein
MKKLITISFITLSLLIIPPKIVLAANLNVECPKSPFGCNVTGDNPLFSKTLDGVWYPGRELTKIINFKNVGSQTREMGIRGAETSLSNDLKQVISVRLLDDANTMIWSGTLSDFYNQGGIVMGTFNAGENKDYLLKVSMDSNAGNDYQGLETKFDLTLGFWGDVVNPPSNPGGPGDGLSDGRSDGKSDGLSSPQSLPPAVLGGAIAPAVLGAQTQEEVLGAATNSATPTPSAIPLRARQNLFSSFTNWILNNIMLSFLIFIIIAIIAYSIYLIVGREKNKKC